MSSLMMSTPFSTQTSPSALISSAEYTEPVGLLGELRMNSLVLGVMASRNCSGVTLNSVSSVVSRITGLAPASLAISG